MSLLADLRLVKKSIRTRTQYRALKGSIPLAAKAVLQDDARCEAVIRALEAAYDGKRIKTHKQIMALFQRAITASIN